MSLLLTLSTFIDALTDRIGKSLYWLVLAAVLISATNAILRKAFNIGSNAWLEVQWYLFSAIFLLGAGYTLLRNEHVRIDVLSSRLSPKGRAWLDLIGLLFFLLPVCGLMAWLAWPFFLDAWNNQETSSNAGGLIRWPVKALIPLGFGLLIVQALSEIIKRVAFLIGRIDDPLQRHSKSLAEELIEVIKAEQHVA